MKKFDTEKIMNLINEGKIGSAGSALSRAGDELSPKEFSDINRKLKSFKWEGSPSGQSNRRRRCHPPHGHQ